MKFETTIEVFEARAKEIIVDGKNFEGWREIFSCDSECLAYIEEYDKETIQSFIANILLDLIGFCKSSGVSFLAAAEECLEQEIQDEETEDNF